MIKVPEICPCAPLREERRWVNSDSNTGLHGQGTGHIELTTAPGYHEWRYGGYKSTIASTYDWFYCIYCLERKSV